MATRKSTNNELVELLQQRNQNNQYDWLIENAKNNRYHDFKNPEDVLCGKMELVDDLNQYPELDDIRQDVMNGVYDEEADEDDKEMLRQDLPPDMRKFFGL